MCVAVFGRSTSSAGRNRVGEQRSPGKPFEIAKQEVVDAWEQVKKNRGAPGVDEVSLAKFETDLKNNLYKIWNRLSSGTYFPPPVRAVEIPKSDGGVRVLGVPTIADRVAQTVAANRLGAKVEPIFHPDSYGYRPDRSALDAIAQCRARCWKYDWGIDMDVAKFFDTVPWDLVEKAVDHHCDHRDRWVLLYVKRWLRAPLQRPTGELVERDRGTPQGSAISPLLANLFMHYAFDTWLDREFGTVRFERYADDVVVHCHTERQARQVLAAIENRMAEVGLQLHPAKTRIVYCKDDNRRLEFEHTEFDFLGYTFRVRGARGRDGAIFNSFQPAISDKSMARISARVRSWRLPRRCAWMSWVELTRWINPIITGWMRYYGAFYPSALFPLLRRINAYLMRWMRSKYKQYRAYRKARWAWREIVRVYPRAFPHWAWTTDTWR